MVELNRKESAYVVISIFLCLCYDAQPGILILYNPFIFLFFHNLIIYVSYKTGNSKKPSFLYYKLITLCT